MMRVVSDTTTAVDSVQDRTVVGDEASDARAVVTGTVCSEHIVNNHPLESEKGNEECVNKSLLEIIEWIKGKG